MRFLPLILVGLLVVQSFPIQGATLFGALRTVGRAWYKGVTCRALSSTENNICRASLGFAGFAAFAAMMTPPISALRKLTKLHRDMKTAIQDHNQELLEQTAPLIMKNNLGPYL